MKILIGRSCVIIFIIRFIKFMVRMLCNFLFYNLCYKLKKYSCTDEINEISNDSFQVDLE